MFLKQIQNDESIEKLKFIILVRGYMQNMDLFGNTYPPTASMINLKSFLAYVVKHKSIVHWLYFIGSFLQARVKNRIFVKLDSSYADYFCQNIKVNL